MVSHWLPLSLLGSHPCALLGVQRGARLPAFRGCGWEGPDDADLGVWCRAPGEQLDVWVMRKADAARLHFWGVSQMEPRAALEALSAVKSIWLLDQTIPIPQGSHWCDPVLSLPTQS